MEKGADLTSFSTERLYVRFVERSDIAALLEYQSDPEVVRFIPWPVRDRDQVAEAIEKYQTLTKLDTEGDYLMLALCRKEDGQVIGQLNAMYRSAAHQSAEFGYVLNPRFGGKGYATEAARALVTSLFATENFHRIFAKMDARNTASQRLCERLGLRKEAHFKEDEWFKNEWTDTLIYSVLKNEWPSAV